MMPKEIHSTGPVDARINVPGSKSITNRALICAALAEGGSLIRNASDSDDTALMSNGLNQFGVLVRKTDNDLAVSGKGGELHAPKFPIPVGNAGTTLRFLLSLSALARGRVVLEGSERMAERPNDDLLEALQTLGVRARRQRSMAHFEVEGGTFRGGVATLRTDKSSQFLSSLLMVAPYATGNVEIAVEGAVTSASYVNLTIDVMRKFGVAVDTRERNRFIVARGGRYKSTAFVVEPDASSASYAFAAAAIAGGRVAVPGLVRVSLQGDLGFVEILERMGCNVEIKNDEFRVKRMDKLRGVDVDMNRMPDIVPTLAVTALFAQGSTRIRNVAQLRHKESNRLDDLATELQKTGAMVSVTEDGLEIEPGPLHGATLDPHDDHRLAMSFALLGLRVPGMMIEDPDCVSKSFPTFWKEFEKFSSNR